MFNLFDPFYNIGMALAIATSDRCELILKNGVYRIERKGKTERIITRFEQSDKKYELRAIKEFDEYIDEQLKVHKNERKIIKTSYV